MATRSFTTFIPVDAVGANVKNSVGVQWTGLLNGDDGAPYVCPQYADKSVQVHGTFGAGGTILLEGTNQQAYTPDRVALAPTYLQLTDPQGNNLSFTAAKIEQVLENLNAIRPRVSAGDGTTSLTCTCIISTSAKA